MIDLNSPALVNLVRQTARSVSGTYPSYISEDDTEQAVWLYVLQKKSAMERLLRQESWEAKLRATITKVAHTHCQKEEGAVNGYSTEDTFDYSIQVLRTLLPDVFDYEDWQPSPGGDGQPKSKGQANETGDRLAMLVDVKAALERLPEDQYNSLVWVYKYHWSHAELGEELDITPEAAKMRLHRALGALQRALGGKSLADMRRGFTGRHRAFGQAEAQAITNRDWNG